MVPAMGVLIGSDVGVSVFYFLKFGQVYVQVSLML